jgi:hypothetical protein
LLHIAHGTLLETRGLSQGVAVLVGPEAATG